HAPCLHLSRHIAQKSLERRQPSCGLFERSDEKSDGAICAPELISAYLARFLRQKMKLYISLSLIPYPLSLNSDLRAVLLLGRSEFIEQIPPGARRRTGRECF
ncbi:MAG: hypothetical protein IJK23_07630, partial [Clostridia bacterium]|nr:hypothetical protein [Clostridia bacterium]